METHFKCVHQRRVSLGALLPSHGLPPFGANITNIAMSEGLCGSSMFGSDRWSVGVTPMTAGKIKRSFQVSLIIWLWFIKHTEIQENMLKKTMFSLQCYGQQDLKILTNYSCKH